MERHGCAGFSLCLLFLEVADQIAIWVLNLWHLLWETLSWSSSCKLTTFFKMHLNMNVVQDVIYLVALWASGDFVGCISGEAPAIWFNCSIHHSASHAKSSAALVFVLLWSQRGFVLLLNFTFDKRKKKRCGPLHALYDFIFFHM